MNATTSLFLNDLISNEEQLLEQIVEAMLDARIELENSSSERQWSRILRQACQERRVAERLEELAVV